MKKKFRCLLVLVGLGLLSNALPSRAQTSTQKDPATAEPSMFRKIVRIISTNDDSPGIEIEQREHVVFVGDDENSESVFVSGFSRKRGYLGVQVIDLTEELRLHFGAPGDSGIMISKVLEESPAAQAGLEPSDILLAMDGEALSTGIQLERRISPLADRTGVMLRILKDGSARNVPVTITERERPTIDLGRLALSAAEQGHGFSWVAPGEVEEHVIRIDPKGLEDALHELEVRIEKPDFVERFGPLGQSRLDLQRRILELEERLENLERQLDKFSDG